MKGDFVSPVGDVFVQFELVDNPAERVADLVGLVAVLVWEDEVTF